MTSPSRLSTDFLALRLFCFNIRQHGRQILYFKLHVDGRKFHYQRPHAAARPQVVHRCIKTTKIFSVRSGPDPPIFKKLPSDPVLIRPKLASVLIQSEPVLIRAHLWYMACADHRNTVAARWLLHAAR